MIPITIKEFADNILKNNEGLDRKELLISLRTALDAKNGGKCCAVCVQPIWAAGSALCGNYLCFVCMTGVSEDENDYEIY